MSRIRRLSEDCRAVIRRDGPDPALIAAVAERVEIPVPIVSSVLRAIGLNMARFERVGFYCFDDATADDLRALAQESGEPADRVATILRALRDAIIEENPATIAWRR